MSEKTKIIVEAAEFSAMLKSMNKLNKTVGDATDIFHQWANVAPELLAAMDIYKDKPLAQASLFPESDWALPVPEKPKPKKLFAEPGVWASKEYSWFDPLKVPAP